MGPIEIAAPEAISSVTFLTRHQKSSPITPQYRFLSRTRIERKADQFSTHPSTKPGKSSHRVVTTVDLLTDGATANRKRSHRHLTECLRA